MLTYTQPRDLRKKYTQLSELKKIYTSDKGLRLPHFFTKILKISRYLCWKIFIFGTLFLVNCSLKICLQFWVHFLGKINFCKFCGFESLLKVEQNILPVRIIPHFD